MEISAERPEWLYIVQQCAEQEGKVKCLPPLGDTLGKGYFSIVSNAPYQSRYWRRQDEKMEGGLHSAPLRHAGGAGDYA